MVQARPVVDQVASPTVMCSHQPIRGQYPGIDQSEARIVSGPEAWPPAGQVMEHWPPESPEQSLTNQRLWSGNISQSEAGIQHP